MSIADPYNRSGLYMQWFVGEDGNLYRIDGWGINSGAVLIGAGVASGLSSGTWLFPVNYREDSYCAKCHCSLNRESKVTATGVSGLYVQYCYSCAEFNWQKYRGFGGREKWIDESIPEFAKVLDNYAKADYLEEQGRLEDAKFIRINNTPIVSSR